jgi:MYXO-CTERM domain-containing protein
VSVPVHRPAPGVPTTAAGPGRVLVAVYAVFALAASARAGVQLLRDWQEAPLAYGLSAVAALVYVLATVALARGARRLATTAVTVELVGVLVVGAFSLADPEAFGRATVWSGFGSGYGYVPLALPVLGLAWLWRSRRRPAGRTAGRAAG